MTTPSIGSPRSTIYAEKPEFASAGKLPGQPASSPTALATSAISSSSSSSSSSSRPFPFSGLPEKALELIARSTGEPQTIRNLSSDCHAAMERTQAYIAARRSGLTPLVARTVLPFRVEGDNPAHVAIAEKVFQCLYSKEHFGPAGTEACSLVLDAFAKLTRTRAFGQAHVAIADLPDHDVAGRYEIENLRLVINTKFLPMLRKGSLNLEDPRLLELMATMLHEMTHAVHCTTFATSISTSDDDLSRELGCTTEEFAAALSESATRLPRHLSRRGPLMLPGFSVSFYQQILPEFVDPANHVRAGRMHVGFAEFLARIPEMYGKYGKTHLKAEIDEALNKISPLAYRVFWGRFREQCERLRKARLQYTS